MIYVVNGNQVKVGRILNLTKLILKTADCSCQNMWHSKIYSSERVKIQSYKKTRLKLDFQSPMYIMLVESHPAVVLASRQCVQFFSALGQSGLIAVTLLLQGLKIRLQLHALTQQPRQHCVKLCLMLMYTLLQLNNTYFLQ